MNNHDDETEVDNDTEGSSGGAIGGKGSHRPPATSSSGGSATQKSRSSQTTGTNSAIAVLNERLLKATKLFGRDHEQEEIINVYNRVKRRESTTSSPNGKKTEFLLIRGSIGTGKSALSERFLLPMVGKDGGYCVTGKFDQLRQLQKPHCFVVEAFTSYAKMVQERGQVETVRRAVNEATTEIESLNLLVKMIPGLAALTGLETKGDVDDAVNKQDDVDSSDEGSYSSNEAASRFKYAVRLLLRSFASVDRPLVLVLEDLHWADEAAMDLLHTLLTDTANQETLFVATYREESDKRNMTTMLKQLQKSEVTVSHIVLKNLDEVSTTNMVVDMLQTDVAYTKPLADLVFSHTKGNAYYIVVFLRALAEGGFLRYDMDAMPQWSWDADEVRVEFGTTMIDVVKNKISCLPDEVLHALKCASCLGSKLDKVILANLMGESSTVAFSYFDLATEKGLLVHCPRRGWAFAHDAIQDAAYSMIPGSDREKFHYDIGLRLWRCFDINELDENIFVVVGQLLAGSRFVEKRKEQIAVARMCLRAGERSVYMSSFQSAFNYLVHGVRLLGTKCWRDEYTLSLNLYNAAAEVAYCSGHSKEVHIFVQEILAHATCLDDTLRGHSANIYAIGSCGRMQEAIHYGIQILSDLGEKFPETQSTTRTFIELQRIRKKLKRKTNESLLRLPIMEDTRKLAAMHMLSQLTTYTFLNAKGLSLTIAFRMVNLSLNCGLSATSCIGFALVGALLCG